MHTYKLIIFLVLSLSTFQLFAQAGPPPMAMPNKVNSGVIDSIIKITKHEQFFTDYCTNKVREYSKLHDWPQSQLERILKSAKFKYYDHTIYNSYADYSTVDLEKLLDVLVTINKKSKPWTSFILTNSMMQNNLDVFVRALIEGKYVTSTD